MRIRIAVLIFLMVISVTQCKEIIGGYPVTPGSGEAGKADSFSPPSINDRTIRDYRDPSQYSSSPFKITRPTSNSNSNNNGADSVSTTTATMVFQMTGDVNGNGSFNEWKEVRDIAGLKAKQASNSANGSVLISNRMAVLKDLSGVGGGFVVSRDTVFFKGRSFLDRESYSNNGDLVQNRFRSGLIFKESIYFGSNSNASSYVLGYSMQNLTERKTTYDLTTKFVGTSSFLARFQNETEIAEDYAGQMEINTSLSNIKRYNRTLFADLWLPCYDCSGYDPDLSRQIVT